MTSTTRGSKKPTYAWVIAAAGFLTQILASMAVVVWGVNLATVAGDFGVPTTSLAIGASLFGIFYAGTSVFWGNLADRIGLRKVLGIGGLTGACLIVLAGLVPAGQIGLICIYALSGIMLGAIGNGVTPKLISTWFSTHQRGKGFMICILGGSLAGATTGLIAPVFIGIGGWRFCFEMIGAIGVVCMVAAIIMVRDSPASVGTVPLGASKEEAGLVDQDAVDKDAQKASNVDRLKRVAKNPKTWIMAIAVILYYFYYTGHQTYFVASLIARGYDLTAASFGSTVVLLGCSLGYVIFSPLSDRVSRKSVLGWLFIGTGIFYFLLYMILQNAGVDIVIVYVVAFCSGLCLGSFAIIQSTESEMFTPDLRGAGPGFISSLSLVGRFFGPLLAAAVIGAMGGVTWGYMAFAAPCAVLAGIIVLIAIPNTSGKYGDPMAEEYITKKSKDATQ